MGGFVLAIVGAVAAGTRAQEKESAPIRPANPPGNVTVAFERFAPVKVQASLRLSSIDPAKLDRTNAEGAAAGTVPGIIAYDNLHVPLPGENLLLWTPGVNPPGTTTELMADDIELAAAGPVTGYSVAVAGLGTAGAPPTYTVRTSLWNGPPCELGSTMIAGTDATSPALANDGSGQLIEVAFAGPIVVPSVFWLAVAFNTDDAGWILAEEAEIGYTRDLWSENDVDGGHGCAQLFLGGDPHVGFWATVYADLAAPPTGACCNGQTCSQQTQADCTTGGGAYAGNFSDCTPNPCLTGACCGGGTFSSCLDTFNDPDLGDIPMSEAACLAVGGLFYAGQTCTESTCGPRFPLYVNDGPIDGLFLHEDHPINGQTLLADDMTMGPGSPCALDHYDLDVFALAFSGAYDVTVELWTFDMLTLLPLEPIPGTQTVFTGVGDGAFRTLRSAPFDGVIVPDNAFMVMRTSTDGSGWILADRAEIGSTEDAFFMFNTEGLAGEWGAFVFLETPTRPIPPYAGFKAALWCQGETPLGACCNDLAGSCQDGVTQQQCDGRWAEGELCAFQPFTPACGAAACCTGETCQDVVPLTCDGLGGVSAPGRFCADIVGIGCPRPACINATGDCFADNRPDIGCEDPFCCEAVCDADDFCCNPNNGWDLECAVTAATLCQATLPDDNCAAAEPITGEGTFPFDNTLATTDGLGHTDCETGLTNPTDAQIGNDVWRCWTAPCTGPVFVQSCNLTEVDTKLAVYEGCNACPPDDTVLLDCNDDFCGYDTPAAFPFQSSISFEATQGQSYLIRIGTFPGGGGFEEAPGGTGSISITCGIPNHHNCPNASAECCTGNADEFACNDQTCCDRVCACDAFCCEVEWDADCAANGFNGNGCGAAALCEATCNPPVCPNGTVTFTSPTSGTVDARQPFPPNTPGTLQGIKSFTVSGPVGIDNPACWSLCETEVQGSPNAITSIVDNGNGTFTINLTRAMSTNAVTTLAYTSDNATTTRGVFTLHPANVNGDTASAPSDILFLIDVLNGVQVAPFGLSSTDADRSTVAGPPDILRVIDLLNGAAGYPNQLNRARPACGACCPL